MTRFIAPETGRAASACDIVRLLDLVPSPECAVSSRFATLVINNANHAWHPSRLLIQHCLNPDASGAEKGGNGLRIFCRYFWDEKLVQEIPFCIETLGGIVTTQVLDSGRCVKVNMRRVIFSSESIPVAVVVQPRRLRIAWDCAIEI